MAAMFTPGALGTVTPDPVDDTEDTTPEYGGLSALQSQLAVMRDKELANRQKSWDMVAQRLEKSRPSKAEMWFSLASALAQPTKTGSFGEVLGNTASALGESAKGRREYETKVADTMLQREQDLAELGSKYDLKGLDLQSKIAATAMKPLGNVGVDPVTNKRFYTTGRFAGQNVDEVAAMMSGGNGSGPSGAQTPLGQIGSQKSGRELGYQNDYKYVITREGPKLIEGQENVGKNAEATTEAAIDLKAIDVAEQQLNKALSLNKQAFSGPLGNAQKTISRFVSPNDPKLAATAKLNTVLGNNVVSALKAALGTQPTDKDLAYLNKLNGLDEGSTAAEREAVINEGLGILANRRQMAKATIGIRAPQSSRQTAPIAPPSKGGAPATGWVVKKVP